MQSIEKQSGDALAARDWFYVEPFDFSRGGKDIERPQCDAAYDRAVLWFSPHNGLTPVRLLASQKPEPSLK